jgi:hypothetical protein
MALVFFRLAGMSRTPIKKQLYRYLQQNPGWHAKGSLERMEWRTRNGTLATADNIGRRLRELAEAGNILVEERKGHAWYAIKPSHAKPRYRLVETWLPDGSVVWVQTPVPSTTAPSANADGHTPPTNSSHFPQPHLPLA